MTPPHEGVDPVCAAQDRGGFGPPGAALLGLRARLVLAAPASRVSPAGPAPPARSSVGGRPCSSWNRAASSASAVSMSARRDDHARSNSGVDSGDLADLAPAARPRRRARRTAPRPARPAALPDGCCSARTRRRCSGTAPARRATATARPGCNLVADRNMGVQIRVAGPRVAVRERGCDQPGRVDLGDAVGAAPGVGGVLLQPCDRVPHRRVVTRGDRSRPARAARSPTAPTRS